MIEFDVFCLKLHRWELLQKINEENSMWRAGVIG